MSFLRLPSGATPAAQGGLVLAQDDPDLSMSSQNPALLGLTKSSRLHCSFMILPGGTKGYFLSAITSPRTASLVTALSVQYIDHGTVPSTDAGGNVLGSFRPRELSLQLTGSLPYKQRWRGGATIQLAHSAYDSYRATAAMANMGIHYRDTALGVQAGAILRHAGFFIRRFDGGTQAQLPTELAFGAWKKWKGSPFSIGLVLQRMQRWQLDDASLFDPALSPIGVDNRRSTFVGQLFNHLILSTRIELHPTIQLMAGYDVLRRRELSWSGGANGLSGFSFGFRAQRDRFQLSYGRSHYQAGQSMNVLSIGFDLTPTSRGWRR